MDLNYSSINAMLYRYFYGSNDMPDSICGYFPRLVLSWLLIIPVSLFSLPAIIFEIIRRQSFGLFRIVVSLFTYFVLMLLGCMVCTVLVVIYDYGKESDIHSWASIGLAWWIFLICVSIIELFKFIKNKKLSKFSNSPLIGFIKSKKEKYCMKINWK